MENDKLAFSIQEGFCGLLMGAIAADGHIDADEIKEFHAAVQKSKTMKGISKQGLHRIIDKCQQFKASHGLLALLQQSAAALPAELHASAYATACDLVFSDPEVPAIEVSVLADIQTLLHVEAEFATDCAEICRAKALV
jgi:uncharacterized tellurite resistance protein B-like protein